MISKQQIKVIQRLQQKKYRKQEGLFIAEGIKVVQEYLQAGVVLDTLFTTDASIFDIPQDKLVPITPACLKKISNLKSPNVVLALFRIMPDAPLPQKGLVVGLDAVNDPGNLGTIIRLCDWFGVTDLVCSTDTVDCYNPKVIQATMGSLTRVRVHYTDLPDFVKQNTLPTYIADMQGDDVTKTTLPKDALLIMGNEANGVSTVIQDMVSHTLTITRFGIYQKTESLNVATATAILLHEFRR